ncbi:hypothetical protein N665_1651s0004 [Sinapis alba]|nr:hypothetical protein N665_1651s0004 [Sinapis alba]
MFSPIRRCSLKGKVVATASNSDNNSSPWPRGLRAITLRGMIPRLTTEDLAELNENERNVVQLNLELEEREASGQVAADDVMQETEPRSSPQRNPDAYADSGAKDKASAEKAINSTIGTNSGDLAELNEKERNVVQFNLELEEREASGQVAADDVMQETEPRSSPQRNPDADADSGAKDKASAEKAINLALADLLPMRRTGTDFEFNEEIDPEQEHRLSIKKNQRWENHLPTKSTFKSVRRLVLQTNTPAGFSFLVPADHQRPWTPPAGYACVYESWFTNCSLWWPLPEFLATYYHHRKIALGQYTANEIRILVTLTVLAAELGIKMSVRLFEELTTPSITMKTGFFYGKMVPKYNVITEKPSKVNFWNHAYFYVKINDASFKDPSVILNGYFNANIDRLSKWSQGGSRSFLEEVEAIRTLSHQHCPDISEARIQTAMNRIIRAEILTERDRNQRMGKLNLSFFLSYADTIGTPVRGRDSPGDSRPAKRRRSSTADQVALSIDPELPLQPERLEERPSADNHETSLLEPLVETEVVITDETPAEEHPTDLQTEEPQGDQPQDPDQTARGDEVVEYPHLIDFKYQHTDIPFVEDHEAPARLFRQIKLKKKKCLSWSNSGRTADIGR